MSQLQGYLIPIIISIVIKAGVSTVDVLLNFSENFPHTTARFQHWLYLLSDDNLDHWHLQWLLLIALLPAYMLLFWDGLEVRSWNPSSTFGSIKKAMLYSFLASKSYSIFVMFYIGWSVPPGGSKLMTWIDLWLESTLTALVAMGLCSIPFCLASLAYDREEFLADVYELIYPPLHRG